MIPSRQTQWNSLKGSRFDVMILGGGASGATLFNQLAAKGYRVLLIDKSDFASATSQSSAMMIWGGLLYLRHLRLGTVWKLCGSRDHLVHTQSRWVKPQVFRYLVGNHGSRGRLLMNAALYSYWALGRCQSVRPRRDSRFNEIDFLRDGVFCDSFLFQEAVLNNSDTRFALDWILSNQSEANIALNYCAITDAAWTGRTQSWSVQLRDELRPQETTEALSRLMVNCTGPWTDDVNRQFGIESPFKHVLSKGVFIGFERLAGHDHPLIMDVGSEGDCMSLIPWGPITLWGPTETCESDLKSALSVQPEDIAMLLRELNRFLKQSKHVEDIISIRNGVRALVVTRDQAPPRSSLELSRKFQIHANPGLPWISIYGGKLTDCVRLAKAVCAQIEKHIGKPGENSARKEFSPADPQLVNFPGLSKPVSSAQWCVEREMCCKLEDYLRRRTNISQWVPRGGLGRNSEYRKELTEIARELPTYSSATNAEEAVQRYEAMIVNQFDQLLTRANVAQT